MWSVATVTSNTEVMKLLITGGDYDKAVTNTHAKRTATVASVERRREADRAISPE